ncbi:MAG: hypothetical protein WAX77_10975 [Methylococcaceae bacterium]
MMVSSSDLSDSAHATLELVKTHEIYRIFCDCTQLEGGHSITDLYLLADAIMTSGIAHKLKEAVLLPNLPTPIENAKFWENTCFNRFIVVRIFDDKGYATQWLLE